MDVSGSSTLGCVAGITSQVSAGMIMRHHMKTVGYWEEMRSSNQKVAKDIFA